MCMCIVEGIFVNSVWNLVIYCFEAPSNCSMYKVTAVILGMRHAAAAFYMYMSLVLASCDKLHCFNAHHNGLY
jgi:hypothetical protein